jgi:hypothetical protein
MQQMNAKITHKNHSQTDVNESNSNNSKAKLIPYLTILGVFALDFQPENRVRPGTSLITLRSSHGSVLVCFQQQLVHLRDVTSRGEMCDVTWGNV